MVWLIKHIIVKKIVIQAIRLMIQIIHVYKHVIQHFINEVEIRFQIMVQLHNKIDIIVLIVVQHLELWQPKQNMNVVQHANKIHYIITYIITS